MKIKDPSNLRGTSWQVLMYEDTITDEFLEVIKKFSYMVAYHDADIKEDGTFKKPHYHYAIKCGQTYLSTIAKKLGVDERWIELWNDHKKNVRYLLHLDYPNKHKYDKSIVYTNTKEWLEWLNDADITPLDVLDAIEQEKPKTYADLIRVMVRYGYWGTFRQAISIYIEAWKELR